MSGETEWLGIVGMCNSEGGGGMMTERRRRKGDGKKDGKGMASSVLLGQLNFLILTQLDDGSSS